MTFRIWIIVFLVPLLIACNSAKAVDQSLRLSDMPLTIQKPKVAHNITPGNTTDNATPAAAPPTANTPTNNTTVNDAKDNVMPTAVLPMAITPTPNATGNTTEPATDDKVLTLVALPDTQYYSQRYPETYNAQTRWISDRWDTEHFDFVVHLGDIVEHYDQEREWQNAFNAMSLLGNHPYTVLPGNHDYQYNKDGNHDYSLFNKYFPSSILMRYDQYPNKGTFPANTIINNYVEVNGYLILSIQFCYDRDLRLELKEWIIATLSENAKTQTIVVTHDFLTATGELSIPGKQLWEILKDYPNVFLVLSGHAWVADNVDKQERVKTLRGTKGNTVNAILSNYQEYLERNSGYMRIYKITGSSIQAKNEAGSKIEIQHTGEHRIIPLLPIPVAIIFALPAIKYFPFQRPLVRNTGCKLRASSGKRMVG